MLRYTFLAVSLTGQMALFSLILACSDSKSRPETADKLKPILVVVNAPSAGQNYQPPLPGTEVHLDFHFIGPTDLGPVTLSPEEPAPNPLSLPTSDWSLEPANQESHPGLQHVWIRAKYLVPSAEQLVMQAPSFARDGLVRLSYTLLASDGQRQVPIAGDFVVYRDLSVTGANWRLTGAIDSPEEGQILADKNFDISSTIDNPQNEAMKIAWFVSAGKIKNRRAASTKWELPGSGSYTLILTVRGKGSRNGDIKVREINLP